MHGGGCVWQGGACVAHMPPRQILRDTVNERAVRVLLECILLVTVFRIDCYVVTKQSSC